MRNKYSWIFKVAQDTLDERRFVLWLCCAYGVLEDSITDEQADILEKLYRQDLEAQKTN